jgi:hypothetical protein
MVSVARYSISDQNSAETLISEGVTHATLRGYAIVKNIVPSDLPASRELTAWV